MPAESHIVSTAADLASQVRARGVDPVAITSATLARISGDSRAVAAFRHVRHRRGCLHDDSGPGQTLGLGELALLQSRPRWRRIRNGRSMNIRRTESPSLNTLALSTAISSNGYAPLSCRKVGVSDLCGLRLAAPDELRGQRRNRHDPTTPVRQCHPP